MKENSKREAQIARMVQLADVDNKRIHEQTHSIGELVNFKRGADNVAYGIVRENHHYYLKKSNSQNEPDAADFASDSELESLSLLLELLELESCEVKRNMLE